MRLIIKSNFEGYLFKNSYDKIDGTDWFNSLYITWYVMYNKVRVCLIEKYMISS